MGNLALCLLLYVEQDWLQIQNDLKGGQGVIGFWRGPYNSIELSLWKGIGLFNPSIHPSICDEDNP